MCGHVRSAKWTINRWWKKYSFSPPCVRVARSEWSHLPLLGPLMVVIQLLEKGYRKEGISQILEGI